MDFIEAIDDYLEAESTVSVNWLANEMGIPISKAVELLSNYSEGRVDEESKSYLLIGHDANNQLVFQLVHGEVKEPVVKTVLSKQIYSIRKTKTENVATALAHSMLRQAESLFLQDSLVQDRESFLFNGLGPIKNSAVQVKVYGERVVSSQNLQFKRSASASSGGATFARPVAASSAKKEEISIPKNVAQEAKSFFERSSSAQSKLTAATTTSIPAATTTTTKENVPNNVTASPALAVSFAVLPEKRRLEKSVTSKGNNDSDDEEWDVDVENVKRPKIAPTTENEAFPQKMEIEDENEASSDEEGVEETENATENKENAPEKKPRKKRAPKKKNVNIHGAMDDFMEDAAIEEHKRQNNTDLLGSQQLPMKMKRVLVEKCSVDERGYFVTEMVWEEVPDDGASDMTETAITAKVEPLYRTETDSSTKENQVNQIVEKKTVEKTVAKPLQPAAKSSIAGKKTETKAATGGQQKSMMSFFGKKN